jgi:hypothetical protein
MNLGEENCENGRLMDLWVHRELMVLKLQVVGGESHRFCFQKTAQECR